MILAVIGMIVAFFFWPKIILAKEGLFDILCIGDEKCKATGTSYETQLQILRISVSKEEYSEAESAYNSLKSCFPKKEKEIKSELVSYFKSISIKKNIVDPIRFIEFVKFTKKALAERAGEIENDNLKVNLREAYLKAIEGQYSKSIEIANKAL